MREKEVVREKDKKKRVSGIRWRESTQKKRNKEVNREWDSESVSDRL